jgi:hypothetical protein
MLRKKRSIIAVETNPLEHVDFRVSDGTELELEGRDQRKRATSVEFHRHPLPQDRHHPPRNIDRSYFCIEFKTINLF